MAAPSGIGLAMKFFGRRDGQTLAEFRDEWNELSNPAKDQLTVGISNGTLTY